MAEAKLRIKLKHDTEANWLKATTFKPLKGELIIYDVDSTHSVPRFKVGDGVKVVGDLPFTDKDFAKLGENNTFTGTNSFTDLLNVASSDFDPANKKGDKLVLHSNKLTYWYGDYARDYNFPSLSSSDSITLAGCQAENTFTATNKFEGSLTQFWGGAYFSGSVDFDGVAPTSRNGLATDRLLSRDSSKTYQMPSKSGTFALTSDIPSFNNFTLLTSKPSDWATNYDTYYKKGDFGFSRNLSDSTWAANKFYSAVPAEIDIQTLTQPIKIQVSGTPGWGEYGGLNLSYGKAKLYGIDNSFEDNVGYIDISNGRLTSAVYNADFTLSNPTGDGYGFSVKDTSTLFSVGLNKSQAGDYAEQYYCNINAPLNVTQIHGFTQLTNQPSDWSTKYSSYYVGFDAFNGDSRFLGRSDGLYKPTNDILLNVGEGYKIQLYGKYKSNINTNYSDITLSSSGISLDCAQELSLNTLTSFSMVSNTADLSAKSVLSLACDSSKLYGFNRFGLTVSGQQAIGVDTSSTSSDNLIRFEMTPKFNTNKIRGMAGNDLILPTSAGTIAHIPAGTEDTAILFGSGSWNKPVLINDSAFANFTGGVKSIYAPISKGMLSGLTYEYVNYGRSYCVMRYGDETPIFVDPLLDTYSRQVFTHTAITSAAAVTWQITADIRVCRTVTIGVKHSNGSLVTLTLTPSMINSSRNNILNTNIAAYGESSTFHVKVTNIATVTGGKIASTFLITNNSYNNLKGMWYIWLDY